MMCNTICVSPTPYYSLDDDTCKSVCRSPYTVLHFDSYTGCQLQISSQDKKAIQNVASVTDKMTDASNAATILASIFSFSDPGAASASMLTKMLQFTKFIKVSHSARLELMLKKSKIKTGFLVYAPKLPTTWRNRIVNRALPYEFIRYQVQSEFLVSFWDGLISLSIVFGILLLVLFVCLIAKSNNFESIAMQKVRVFAQNFLLTQFYRCYGDIVLFSILDFLTTRFDAFTSIISFSIAIVFTVLGTVVLVLHFLFLLKYQETKRQSDQNQAEHNALSKFIQHHKGIHVLFFNFKDTSLISQSCFLLLALRSIAFSIIISLLQNHPLVQNILLVCLCCFMIAYLLILRPFKSVTNLVEQLLMEGILLVISVSLMGVAIIDSKGDEKDHIWTTFNEIIIICNMLASSVVPVCLVVKIVIAIVYYAKKRRSISKRKENRRVAPASSAEMNSTNLALEVSNSQNTSTLMASHIRNEPIISIFNSEIQQQNEHNVSITQSNIIKTNAGSSPLYVGEENKEDIMGNTRPKKSIKNRRIRRRKEKMEEERKDQTEIIGYCLEDITVESSDIKNKGSVDLQPHGGRVAHNAEFSTKSRGAKKKIHRRQNDKPEHGQDNSI